MMKRPGEEHANSHPQKKHKQDRSHSNQNDLLPSQQSEPNKHLQNLSNDQNRQHGSKSKATYNEASAQLPQPTSKPGSRHHPPQKSYNSQKQRHDRGNHHHHKDQRHTKDTSNPRISYDEALAELPPPTSTPGSIPSYVPFTVPSSLPPLPQIKDPTLTTAPFTHRSALSAYNRATQPVADITYERLEFLGDAYIELIASRLLFSRFGHLTSGQQSQLRELLVKNETLAEYSRLYGFEGRVSAGNMEIMHAESKVKGNKGFNKVLGDVFEAYVAAVILSDCEEGFAVAERWLTALWAPKLGEAVRGDVSYRALVHSEDADPLEVYDPAAKAELQKRLVADKETRLEYETFRDSVELKGDQLGQNRHFIALYLTGYGYERKLLGKGEGKNKVEAGNWAAIQAMFGESKRVVEECEAKLLAIKVERKKEKAKEGK